MQFSLKNTSIRIQVLLPVVLTALALFISLGFTASTLEEEQDIIASNTDSFVFYKDQLAKVDDEVYPLRISAVYAIYDTDRRANFTNELRTKVDDINVLLDELEARKTFAKEVNLVRTNINNYVQFSHKVIEYLNKKESGQAVSQSYDALISQYRNIGNSMVSSINALSQRVNEFSDIAMKESYEKNTQVKTTAGLTILAVFIISMITAWWLSGLIVNPIQQIQLIIRRLAEGDLTVRANADGDNEIATLSKDINTTASQLQTTVEALSRISEDVAAASTELAAVMTEAENNSQQELSEIEQVASAVNELSSTANNVSDNALAADKTARETNELAHNGLDI